MHYFPCTCSFLSFPLELSWPVSSFHTKLYTLCDCSFLKPSCSSTDRFFLRPFLVVILGVLFASLFMLEPLFLPLLWICSLTILYRIQMANYFPLKALFHCLLSFQGHFWEVRYHFKSYYFVCNLSIWTLLVLFCIIHNLTLHIGIFHLLCFQLETHVLQFQESFHKLFLDNFLLLCLLIWTLNSIYSLSLLSYPCYFPSFCFFITSNLLTL